jgi:5'-3' exonuclease
MSSNNNNKNNHFLFIDGSYFIFHRIYSVINWWKRSHPGQPVDHEDPFFTKTFNKTFRETLDSLLEKTGMPANTRIFVAKDCRRADIWRTALYPEYKAGRVCKEESIVKALFKHVYENGLYHNYPILQADHLEADDCIALAVRKIQSDQKILSIDISIAIITSDNDYLQLSKKGQVRVFDLAFHDLSEKKTSHGDPECDLFCKSVMGDPSDNIKPVFKGCGPKTAYKYWLNRDAFEERLKKDPNSGARYELNRTLVDFRRIPEDLALPFLETLKGLEL